MKKLARGDKGFLEYKKKQYFMKTFLFIGIGIGIFVLGLLLNKMDKKNIFTVLSVLMVLPMARSIVGVAALFPYKGASMERYHKVKSLTTEEMKLFSDLVITSSEKGMNLDFLIEIKGSVIGLIGKKGQNVEYIQEYLTKGIRNFGTNYNVKIYEEEKAFLRAIEGLSAHGTKEEEKAVLDYLTSLIVS